MESRLTGRRSGSTSRSSRSGARRPPPPKKHLGQHFLSDANILNRIVDAAALTPGDVVLEVGPGRGALTEVLAARGMNVVAVEVDGDLAGILQDRFRPGSRVTVIEADVLDHAPDDLLARAGAEPPYAVVANLPYNIAAPVIRRLLEAETPPFRLVAMVQLEVAESIVAPPPHMTLLGVATQVYADVSMVLKLPPGAFSPPPRVQSAVVRLDVRAQPRVEVPLDAFFRIVRAGFGNPRKQLRNSLSFGLHVKQEVVDDVMRRAEIDATLRPQVLAIEDWASISRAWTERVAP